jgi:hypothetical protein
MQQTQWDVPAELEGVEEVEAARREAGPGDEEPEEGEMVEYEVEEGEVDESQPADAWKEYQAEDGRVGEARCITAEV